MCDTFSISADYSNDGICYFAKNSDRSPNEPHLIIHVPAADHPNGAVVSCTYISIPQVSRTHEMILCKPSWIWGAEMGVNDARVAIGNEAVFTRARRGAPALTGMDMLRLALERSDNAARAVEILISLLETHGQGGNCGFDHPFYYDNSFLVADPCEAYIMETAGKNYAVKRAEGKCAISNRLTIGTEHSARSGLGETDHFAQRFTEPVYSHFSAAKLRRHQVLTKLSPATGTSEIINILRGHEPGLGGLEFRRGSVKSVCMHAGGLIGDHTTGSLVAVLRQDKPMTLWCTGSSTPCISSFKPVFFGSQAAPVFEDPQKSKAYWLQREQLHRAVIAGLVDAAVLRDRIKILETSWFEQEQQLMNETVPDIAALHALSNNAAVQEQSLVNEFSVSDWQTNTGHNRYAKYWRRKNTALAGQG